MEKELDDLIAGCWTDVDLASNTVRITHEKGSNPRVFKISSRLASMLANLPKKSVKVFTYKNKFYLRKSFEKQRKRVAFKLGNPKASADKFPHVPPLESHDGILQAKDILHVMQLLGHKNIKNTLIYTQLVQNINEDEYVCKAAKTVEEAKQLIEAGFEYVCDMEDCKLFRKRK